MIAQQLDAMAYIMEDCANEETDVTAKEGKITASMRYAWKELGVLVEQLRILENSHGNGRCCFREEPGAASVYLSGKWPD